MSLPSGAIITLSDNFEGSADDDYLDIHSPQIDSSARGWTRLNGQVMQINPDLASVSLANTDFSVVGSLYSAEACTSDYVLRVGVNAVSRFDQFQIYFRVDKETDTCYCVTGRHNTTNSYIWIQAYRLGAASMDTVAVIEPDDLEQDTQYYYQIIVSGNHVQVIIEGVDHDFLGATMDFNLTRTRIGIGGTRTTPKFTSVEVMALPSLSGTVQGNTDLDILRQEIALLSTATSSAISALRTLIAESVRLNLDSTPLEVDLVDNAVLGLVDGIKADPPTVNLTNETYTELESLFNDALTDYDIPTTSDLNSFVASAIATYAREYTLAASVTSDLFVFEGETTNKSVSVFQADGLTPFNLADPARTYILLFEDKHENFIASIGNDNITISGASSNIFTFTWPAAVTNNRKQKVWSLRDASSPRTVYAWGFINIKRTATKTE